MMKIYYENLRNSVLLYSIVPLNHNVTSVQQRHHPETFTDIRIRPQMNTFNRITLTQN